jgi:hypothetical protein
VLKVFEIAAKSIACRGVPSIGVQLLLALHDWERNKEVAVDLVAWGWVWIGCEKFETYRL